MPHGRKLSNDVTLLQAPHDFLLDQHRSLPRLWDWTTRKNSYFQWNKSPLLFCEDRRSYKRVLWRNTSLLPWDVPPQREGMWEQGCWGWESPGQTRQTWVKMWFELIKITGEMKIFYAFPKTNKKEIISKNKSSNLSNFRIFFTPKT